MSLALMSFVSTVIVLLLLQRVFRRFGWMDKPHLYGYQREPVPYGLGVVFYLIFSAFAFVFLKLEPHIIAVIVSGGILTLTCFLDDHLKLSPLPRFLIQVLCAVILVLAGIGVPAISNPLGDPIVLDSLQWQLHIGSWSILIEPWADLVAVLWIVFVINAVNWLDGVPGVVSGVSSIACTVLYLLATMKDLHVIDQSSLSTMALILGGSTLAFLVFDFPKPKILMGDSGTMFLGMMIAVMAIFSGGKLATAFIVLAIPILDALWTIVRRIINGQSPWRGDFQHFHHELLRAGMTERQVDLFFFSLSLGFGIAALSLQSFGKMIAILSLFALMVVIRWSLLDRRKSL